MKNKVILRNSIDNLLDDRFTEYLFKIKKMIVRKMSYFKYTLLSISEKIKLWKLLILQSDNPESDSSNEEESYSCVSWEVTATQLDHTPTYSRKNLPNDHKDILSCDIPKSLEIHINSLNNIFSSVPVGISPVSLEYAIRNEFLQLLSLLKQIWVDYFIQKWIKKINISFCRTIKRSFIDTDRPWELTFNLVKWASITTEVIDNYFNSLDKRTS